MSTIEVNKITPVSGGTNVTLGDSGDTFTIPSGATITNNGTSSGFNQFANWSESSGNLLPGNASYGIYLGVNSATASNLLDDYEEGTWTPTFSNYSGTDQNATGYYTKVGNLVTAGCRIGTDGTSDSSVATIAGLPFTVRASTEDGAIGGGLVSYTTGLAAQRWYAINNTATVKCADGTGNDVNYNDFGANKDVRMVITYFV